MSRNFTPKTVISTVHHLSLAQKRVPCKVRVKCRPCLQNRQKKVHQIKLLRYVSILQSASSKYHRRVVYKNRRKKVFVPWRYYISNLQKSGFSAVLVSKHLGNRLISQYIYHHNTLLSYIQDLCDGSRYCPIYGTYVMDHVIVLYTGPM